MSNLDRQGKNCFEVTGVAHENLSRVSPVQLSLKLSMIRLLEVLCFLDPYKPQFPPERRNFPPEYRQGKILVATGRLHQKVCFLKISNLYLPESKR